MCFCLCVGLFCFAFEHYYKSMGFIYLRFILLQSFPFIAHIIPFEAFESSFLCSFD